MKQHIAIIIPALNEEVTIEDVVSRCLTALDASIFKTSVIVVNDGSKDQTAALAEKAGAQVVSHAANMGVGRAFRTGLSQALTSGADVVVNIDADGQFDPLGIPSLIEPILSGRADFTTASRFKDPALIPDMPKLKLWGNRMMSKLISSIANQKFHDVSCGFRAYNRETALCLNLWGDYTYTQESILDLVIKEMRIEEVPMAIDGVRKSGTSRVASNLWRYGFKTLKIILHTYLDYWPIHFFSWISLPPLIGGLGLVCFLMIHRLTSGGFSPHIWAGFTGTALFAFGVIVFIVGLVGQMLKRVRLNQEMLLYYERRKLYAPKG